MVHDTPYDDPGWMGDDIKLILMKMEMKLTETANRWGHAAQMERCKAIGVSNKS